MALFLIRATRPEQRNSSVNAFIVDAADATAARAAALAAAPHGEAQPKPGWEAVALTSAITPLLVCGVAVVPGNGELRPGE